MRYPFATAARLLLMLAVGVVALNLLALGNQFRLGVMVLLGVVAYRKAMRFRGTGNAYGSARASGFADLMAAGMLGDDGLMMGDCRYLDPPTRAEGLKWLFSPIPSHLACKLFLAAWLGRSWASDIVIRIQSYVHIGTFAPAGAGKGVSAVIPTLKSYRGSVVVTDPKGENYKKTGDFRRRKMGHSVYRCDPFDVCGPGGHGMNPMTLLPKPGAKDFLNACRDLANALIVRTGKEENPHWNNRSEDVLCSVIVFVKATQRDPKQKNLAAVRRIVASEETLLATITIMRTKCTGLVKQLGDSLSFLKPGTEEYSGVMSTIQQQTSWLDGEAVAECLSRDDMDPRDLRSGRTDFYFVLPPARLETLASLNRVWLATTLGLLSQQEASEANPVLFLIDEAAHLGRLRPLENALTLLRGYGIRVWQFFQSLGQLQEVYGDKAQVILDNLGTQQYFGITSYESAEAVSKRIGDMTVAVVSENESRSHSHSTGPSREPQPGNASTSHSVNISEHGRRLYTASEILTMPSDEMLLMHNNMHVIPTGKIRYYASTLFRWGRTGGNRGIGLGGIAATLAVGVVALMLSAVVAKPPALPKLGRLTAMADATPRNARSVPGLTPPPASRRYTYFNGRPVTPARPRIRNNSGRLPSRSGFLIRIPGPRDRKPSVSAKRPQATPHVDERNR